MSEDPDIKALADQLQQSLAQGTTRPHSPVVDIQPSSPTLLERCHTAINRPLVQQGLTVWNIVGGFLAASLWVGILAAWLMAGRPLPTPQTNHPEQGKTDHPKAHQTGH